MRAGQKLNRVGPFALRPLFWSTCTSHGLPVHSPLIKLLLAVGLVAASFSSQAGSAVNAQLAEAQSVPAENSKPVTADPALSDDTSMRILNSSDDEKIVVEVPKPSFIKKPQWEFGIGGGYFSGFDYPASRDENKRSIAAPFFIYRSPLLRFGDGGIRAVAIENPRIKLDLSLGGSLNSSSEGNSVREGMPDLDFLFEFGPQVELRLFDQSLESGARWRGRVTSELRAVLSTDFKSLDRQGFVAEFGLGVNLNNVAGSSISLISALDVTFADERLQDYFYQVDPEFVTDTRPGFDARSGYLETTLFTAIAVQPLPRVRVFLGVSKGFFDGAANQDSPLFETTEQTRFALGIVWTIKTSDTMIDIVEMGVRE